MKNIASRALGNENERTKLKANRERGGGDGGSGH